MKIQSMFQKDIDRPINGVVKVMQDDQQSLKDELSEYIITKELRRHFATFFDNYVKAIDTPTDKIGVWISGFFGSGKSPTFSPTKRWTANTPLITLRTSLMIR